jgi:rhodanese-related sulfurtransferase
MAFIVFSVVLVMGCATGNVAGKTQAQVLEDVSPVEAYGIIQKNENKTDFKVLDVRAEYEFKSGHLANAENIDYFDANFRDELNALNKNDTYVIYCKSGSRSGKAFQMMKELGFTHVYNIIGGIMNWEKEKLPVVR